MDILETGKEALDIEIKALQHMRDTLNGDFIQIIEAIKVCTGKVILTGMGKPGHIGTKIAATMSSLGTPTFFLHPAEALHGDLGMVSNKDIVIAISNSGESDEIVRILPNIKMIGAKLIAISANPNSTLVKYSDISYIFPKVQEACPMDLAPTSSTTIILAFGDALAITLSKLQGFKKENYALFHPAGSLGKKLLVKVRDLMHKDERNATICMGSSLKNAILEMSSKALSIVSIVDQDNRLVGVLTDGDLRRILERGINVYECYVDEMMTRTPVYVDKDMMAVEALKLLTDRNISALPVIDEGMKVVGIITIHDITKAGILL